MKNKVIALAAMAAFGLISTQALAAGDAAKGKVVFNRCAACHSDVKGQNRVGPSLFGVVGRTAGTEAGFHYSPAFEKVAKADKLVWTEANLDKWLTSPKAMIPGTRMTFPGLPSAQDRADVIAFLATKK